MLIPGVPGRN